MSDDRSPPDLPFRIALAISALGAAVTSVALLGPMGSGPLEPKNPRAQLVAPAPAPLPAPVPVVWPQALLERLASDFLQRFVEAHQRRDRAQIEAFYDASAIGVAVDRQGKERRMGRAAWLAEQHETLAKMSLESTGRPGFQIDVARRLATVTFFAQLLDGQRELGRPSLLQLSLDPSPRILEDREWPLEPGWGGHGPTLGLQTGPDQRDLDLGVARWLAVAVHDEDYAEAHAKMSAIRKKGGKAEIVAGDAVGEAGFLVVVGASDDAGKARKLAGKKGKVVDAARGERLLPGWDLSLVATAGLVGDGPLLFKNDRLQMAVRDPGQATRAMTWRLDASDLPLVSVLRLPPSAVPWRAFDLDSGRPWPQSDALDRPYELPGKEAVIGNRRYRFDATKDKLLALDGESELWGLPMQSKELLVQVFPWKKGILLRRGRELMFFAQAPSPTRRMAKLSASVGGFFKSASFLLGGASVQPVEEIAGESARFELWLRIPIVLRKELENDGCVEAKSILLADFDAWVSLDSTCRDP